MINTITVQDLKDKLQQNPSTILVDVREPFEHEDFNIGGTLLPLGKLQTMQIDDIEQYRNSEVIVYCRSGNRSAQGCLILQQLGFTNVINLAGGMMAWQASL